MDEHEAKYANELRDHDLTRRRLEAARDTTEEFGRTLHAIMIRAQQHPKNDELSKVANMAREVLEKYKGRR